MLVILTNSDDATADYVLKRLREESIPYCRINTDDIMAKYHFSYTIDDCLLHAADCSISAKTVSALWYRRPLPIKSHSDKTLEAEWISGEWTAALEGWLAHVPIERWINHPSFIELANSKMEQITRAKKYGFLVPDSLVTQNREDFNSFWQKHNKHIVAKPLLSGYVESDTLNKFGLIYTTELKDSDLFQLDDLSICPTFFQEKIDKIFDVRITVFDSKLTALKLVREASTNNIDIRIDNFEGVLYEPIDLPKETEKKILQLLHSYSLRFAAIDMVVNYKYDWFFLEINPNGQWAWTDVMGISDIYSSFKKSIL